jgi:hypothetical protein
MLQCAGPVSRLLEHLRNQLSGSLPDGNNTLDAYPHFSSSHREAAQAAKTVARGAAAQAMAQQEGVDIGVTRNEQGSELDLKNRGLLEVPAEVWDAGAHVHRVHNSLPAKIVRAAAVGLFGCTLYLSPSAEELVGLPHVSTMTASSTTQHSVCIRRLDLLFRLHVVCI